MHSRKSRIRMNGQKSECSPPAVENTAHREQSQLLKALRESELLRELAELLASSLDLTRILQVLAKRTTEVCEVSRCSVWLFGDANDTQPGADEANRAAARFIPSAYHMSTQNLPARLFQTADRMWHNSFIAFNNPVIDRLLEQAEPLIVDDLRAQPGLEHIAEKFFVRSTLLVALMREGRLVGMLSLDNPGQHTTFTPDQSQLARAIGQQAAVAIDNARLYQEAQTERQKAARLIERAQSVYQVAMAVNSGAELPEVLEIATQHLTSHLRARSAVIALLEHERLVLSNTRSRSYTRTYSPHLSVFPHCYSSIEARAPLFVRHDKLNTAEARWFQQLGMDNILFVPLFVGDGQQQKAQNKPIFGQASIHPSTHCIGFAFVDHARDQKAPTPGYLAFAQDIAAHCALAIDKARLLAETRRAMALSDERANTLDAIFNAMTEGILVLDLEGRVILSNSTVDHMLGLSSTASRKATTFLRDQPITTLTGVPISPDDAPISRGLQGDQVHGERFLRKTPDGDEVATEINIVPLLTNEDEKIGIVSAFRDITEQVRVERRLRRALTTMLHAAEAISGILDIEEILNKVLSMSLSTLNNERGIIQLFDTETQTFTPLAAIGFSDEEIEPWLREYKHQLISTTNQQQFKEGRARLISNEVRHQADATISHSMVLAAPITYDHHVIGLMLLDRSVTHRAEENKTARATPHTTRATRPLAALEFNAWDIAVIEGIAQFAGLALQQARLQQEAEIARLNEANMRESNAQKDEILAITAHEFRTPLTVIMAHSQMMTRILGRTQDASPQLKERLLESNTFIEDQTRQLTNIVNTFLEVTRLNRGKITLKQEVIDVVSLITDTISNHRATSTIHQISYHTAPSERPYTVNGDHARLLQVFANLLQNAIKYSPQGGPITFTIAIRNAVTTDESVAESPITTTGTREMIEITIIDKGIGVPLEAQSRLFECFYRAPNIGNIQARGVGLGLYVVAEFLHLHGGTISVESSGIPGEGSRFIVSLPLLTQKNPPQAAAL